MDEAAQVREYREWATHLPSLREGLPPLLDALAARMATVTGAPIAAILRHDDGVLVPASTVGIEPALLDGARFPLVGASAVLARVLQADGAVYVPDLATAAPAGLSVPLGLRSALLAPLRAGDRILGVAAVGDTGPRAFTPAQLARFEALVDRAVAGLENARLYQESQERTRQLEALVTLAGSITAEMEPHALADRVTAAACDLVSADYCALATLVSEDDRDGYAFSSVHAPEMPPPVALLHGSKLLALALDGESRARVPDLRTHPRGEELDLGGTPFRSLLSAPLWWDGRPRAVLLLAREDARAFGPADAEFLRLLCAQAAAAFHNAALLDEIQQRGDLAAQRSYLLETLIASIPDPVYIGAQPGVIVDVNDPALETLGMARDEITRPLMEYLPLLEPRFPDGASMPVEEQPLARALAGETFSNLLMTFHRAGEGDGERDKTFSFSGAPVRNARGEIILAVCVGHDVTGELDLQRAREELMSVASHELKTPLTLVKANAQMLARAIRKLDDRRLLARSEALNAQVERMQRLVDLLLDISRLETGRLTVDLQPLDLAAVVRDTVESFRLTHPERGVRVVMPEGEVRVRGDGLRLEQVLANLLGNAARYSPPDAALELELEDGADAARVTVRDRGIGIPPEDLDRIFDRFYQVQDSPGALSGSMGMGLYISRGIVEAHGGRIRAESRLGHGSAFHFTIPRDGDTRD